MVVTLSLLVIAGIAAVFGMLTAVASDLPQLSNQVQYQANVDSVLYDDTGKPIGVLAPPNQPVIDRWSQISQNMVHAIVSVEDKHFWTDPGIDLKSIARAFLNDIAGGPTQGASTIAEEFVKNALAEQNNRTILEKLREAGLAFQLVHRWKRTKILTQYLNIIYFGNGAYGIESAARIYFGKQLGYDPTDPSAGRCGTATVQNPHLPSCASLLKPYQAALLAGIVANPGGFNPLYYPSAARARRNLVLSDMLAQRYITRQVFTHANARPLPTVNDIQQPAEPPSAPYFTSWVRPQIITALEREGVPAKIAPYEAYYGGLKIKLTINLAMQQAAQQAVDEFIAQAHGPSATLISIDNATGEVRAMVSGNGDYQADPFNLATLGYRQPGSAFKLFTLAQALGTGDYTPSSIIDSHPLDIPFRQPDGAIGHFIVHNYANVYTGPTTLAQATAVSDNSVFVQVGMHVGTVNIARQAHLLGIRSPVSTNPAMIIGGLSQGVSNLDLTHAYETVANGGEKVYNPILGDVDEGPIGIHSIAGCGACAQHDIVNHPTDRRVMSASVAATIHSLLQGVVATGTGGLAAIPGVDVAGKTGTTNNEVDAWFCGWTPQLTTCVWMGYPNSGKAMLTNWNGQPVVGGSFPAEIWKAYTEAALNLLAGQSSGTSAQTSAGSSTATAVTAGGSSSAPSSATVPSGAVGAATPPATVTTPAGNGPAGTTPATTTPASTTPVTPAGTTPAAPVSTTPGTSTGGSPPPPTTGTGGASSGGAGLGG
ncbi:transglycosylase domain-containing protein [Conexibacter sp. DBS9H8]|uniref:transglycosylase domain-containing protein n=1 Tax=Conexibacter sp. DBS9H8 TaxID=2937801 RepID=UPI00200EB417|nr:transglycosylase domain-containing protein [Conexibacter sp. DBS9H8]